MKLVSSVVFSIVRISHLGFISAVKGIDSVRCAFCFFAVLFNYTVGWCVFELARMVYIRLDILHSDRTSRLMLLLVGVLRGFECAIGHSMAQIHVDCVRRTLLALLC